MPDREMVETLYVEDIFINRLAKMERVGPCMRMYFCADQDDITVVRAKFIVPIESLGEIAKTRLRMMDELGTRDQAAPVHSVHPFVGHLLKTLAPTAFASIHGFHIYLGHAGLHWIV